VFSWFSWCAGLVVGWFYWLFYSALSADATLVAGLTSLVLKIFVSLSFM